METRATLQALCLKLGIPRTHVDYWIRHGHFRPNQDVNPGETRLFQRREAVQLACLARLTRKGMDLGKSLGLALQTALSDAHTDDRTYLVVIDHGPCFQTESAKTKSLPPSGKNDPHGWDHAFRLARGGDGNPYSAHVVAWDKVRYCVDHFRSIAVINLADVEKEVDRAMPRASRFDAAMKASGDSRDE